MPAETITICKSEGATMDVFAKAADGTTTLSSPSDFTLVWAIAKTAEETTYEVELDSASNGSLLDSSTAKFRISATYTDLASLVAGQTYYYNTWVEPDSGTGRIRQQYGKCIVTEGLPPTS